MAFTKEKVLKAWEVVKNYLLTYLKQNYVKLAVAQLVKAGFKVAGFKEWVLTLILDHLYEDIGEPLVKLILRRVDYTIEYIDGQMILKKLEVAKNEHSQADYDHAMDDLLN